MKFNIEKSHISTINNHCTVLFETVPDGVKLSCTCFSYDTPVLRIDENNNVFRLWDGWSMTTQRDINRAFPGLNMDKKTWLSMPVEK